MTANKYGLRTLFLTIVLISAGVLAANGLHETQPPATPPAVPSSGHPETQPTVSQTNSTARTAEVNGTTSLATTVESDVKHNLSLIRARATVFLNCTYFWIDVTPDDVYYTLDLTYRETSSDQRIRILAGPLNGRAEDPFAQYGFLLLRVEVRVAGVPSVAVYIPRRCL